jgi:hypothetical protein
VINVKLSVSCELYIDDTYISQMSKTQLND